MWNTRCDEVDFGYVLNNTYGSGGTEPVCILNSVETLLKQSCILDVLVLITDGQIDAMDVDTVKHKIQEKWCSELPWSEAETHILLPRGREPDTSVVAPFINGVPYKIYTSYCTSDPYSGPPAASCTLGMQACVETIRKVCTAAHLDAVYDEIASCLAAATITQSADEATREALLQMKNRVLATEARATTPGEEVVLPLATIERMACDFYNSNGNKPAQRIDTLVTMCTKASGFSLSRLTQLRNQRLSHFAPAVEISDVPDVEDCKWDDEILMDQTSCILIPIKAASAGILRRPGIDKDVLEAIQRNPLLLMRSSELVDQIVAAFLPPLSREVLSVLLKTHMPHPSTRDDMLGAAICLGDSSAHVRANKACLAQLLYGSDRFIGSYGLWMTLVWYLMRDREYLLSRQDSDRFASEHLLRSKTVLVPMGLTCDGSRPVHRVSLGTAFLYCVHSCKLFAASKYDAMLDLFDVYPVLKDALSVIGIATDEYDDRVDTLRRCARILWNKRRLPADEFLDGYLSAVAESVSVAGQTVCLDRKRSDYLMSSATSPAVKDLALCLTVDSHKKLSDQAIPWNFDAVAVVENAGLFGKFSTEENQLTDVCDICPRTLRPWSQVDGRPWEEIATALSTDKISTHQTVLRYVELENRLPDPDNDTDVSQVLLLLKKRYGPILPATVVAVTRMIMRQVCDAVSQRPLEDRTIGRIVSDIRAGYSRSARREMERMQCSQLHLHSR